jgi:hypothetical protein
VTEPLVVKLPHELGKEEALRRVKPALGKTSSSFPCSWWRRRGRMTG